MIMNISALTTGFAVFASLLLCGCTVNGIANSNVSIDGNEAKATVKKTVKINNFNEIDASQGIKVVFTQGPNKGIAEISTTPSAEKYLKVEVKDNTLKAYYANIIDKKNAKIQGPSIIRVSSPVLCEVDLSSAANVSVEGNLTVNGKFELDLSSASSFYADNVSCDIFEADLSSSASANIGNISGEANIDMSSASSINIDNLNGNVDAEASSAASIKINSIKSSSISAEASSGATIQINGVSGGNISASSTSGSKITLSGKADYLKQHASSGGSVNTGALKTKR